MSRAQEIFDLAFFDGRTLRSEAYRAGVMDRLRFGLEGRSLQVPYEPGTAEFDAFFAGVSEGADLLRYAPHLLPTKSA